MSPFGVVVVAIVGVLFVVALASSAGRQALVGRARTVVATLLGLAIVVLLIGMVERLGR